MGTVHVAISAGLFIIETILQLCVVGYHSKNSEALFVILLAIVMAPLILINFVSAIQVTRTQDFTGKTCGRILCIAFHSVQLGIVWRSLKLLILFDKKDWHDYIKMRLFHAGFQSIPFSIVLAYSMFVARASHPLDILSIILALASASVSLTIFRVSNALDSSDDADSENEDINNKCNVIRKHIGVILLVFSTSSVVFSRCASIVLFTVVQPYWIALPLSLHFLFHLTKACTRLKCSDDNVLNKILRIIYTSFVNIFDLVGRDYTGVKCSYVFYYTIMLIENLVFSFYWMMTSSMEERSKLYGVLIVLLCFIVGMIVKFMSCGCIFNVESDILSDAFNNPELQDIKKDKQELEKTIETVAEDVHFHEICHDENDQLSNIALHVDQATPLQNKSKRRSKRGSSTTSSNSRLREYDNQAFVRSQGNISFNSQNTGSCKKHSHDEGDNVSFEYRTISRSSQENSRSSRDRSREQNEKRRKHSRSPNKKSNRASGQSKSKRDSPVQRVDVRVHYKENRVPNIIVSDTSKHAQQIQNMSGTNVQPMKVKNSDLASSHSKYSRNTNTLNGSVQNYRYNGFDDPFRERRRLEINSRKQQKRHDRHYHDHHHHHYRHHRHQSNLDYSLDSSELYPSMTSDTSSMTSYTDTNEHLWQKHRQKIKRRNRHLDIRDGYSTDVSNSDNLSYNDFSMEDSSSWTGSSSSSSDGAATWPPRHTANLLKAYNIPDKESSAENIIHWLETMETEASEYDSSFSGANEPPSDTDMSLSGMQNFEVKKEKKKFKRMISKPKGLLLKFSSLNYKRRDTHSQNRPFPVKQNNPSEVVPVTTEKGMQHELSLNNRHQGVISDSTMPIPVERVQESIV
ncbi:hypothetical protein ACF0H5_005213 [Mactra antiquata]